MGKEILGAENILCKDREVRESKEHVGHYDRRLDGGGGCRIEEEEELG